MVRPRTRLLNTAGAAHPGGLNRPFLCCWACGVETSAVVAFLVAGSLGLAVGFLIPLYVQIVQDRTPLYSAVAILPYALAVAVAGVVSLRLYALLAAPSWNRLVHPDCDRSGGGRLHRRQRLGHHRSHPGSASR